ncbi:MAG TPA: TonB-dependent receptor [Steroidobacteraceae bacterium]|nr:TonB-dependent receptor [Steroidobacteraceae bacterium]
MRQLMVGMLLLAAGQAIAGGVPGARIGEIEVTGTRLEGQPESASDGVVLREQLEHRPILRTGELLEVVPGLIVTQHSGSGKANQYFLRGFNLDHGTDLATRVEDMPVNMPTHAHGQGYSDINFVIPELIGSIEYRKGTHHLEEGNFSAAGSMDLHYAESLPDNLISVSGGEDNYRRAVIAGSPTLGGGSLLYGLEYATADGPWDLPEDLKRRNAVLRYSRGDSDNGWAVEGMAYEGDWRSTDQVPQRAIDSGLIDRFGFIDPTDGGNSSRYSLSASWQHAGDASRWRASVYGLKYDLDLFSNFTYFTDPVNGDQFEQFDDRRAFGGRLTYGRDLPLGPFAGELAAGVEVRRDDIDTVGLYRTVQRERIGTIRQDNVRQTSYSAFVGEDVRWSERLRTNLGVRFDAFDFDVDSDLAANSGQANDSIVSPKFSSVYSLSPRAELFFDYGWGFHSNDARGTTITVDPSDGVTPAQRVDPLVRAKGTELGTRVVVHPGWQVSAALWDLDLDSELLFVGDGGTTEASRASRRYGVELGLYAQPIQWLILDVDFAWSHARFTDEDPAGDRIPGAVQGVASAGLAIDHPSGWFGGARLRYLGSAPLIEDNSVRSDSTTVLNLDAGYRITKWLSAAVSLLNVFDAKDNDISYYYESQLQGEPAPVADIHLHPVEPRTLRVELRAHF